MMRGMMRARLSVILLAALVFPGAARAECIGGGCYDDLLIILILLAVGALIIIGLVVWLAVRLVRRWLRKRRAGVTPG